MSELWVNTNEPSKVEPHDRVPTSIPFNTVCIPNGLTYPSRTLALLVKPSHAVPYEQGKEAAVT